MEALKQSLAEGGGKAPAAKRKVGPADRRQGHMLLPVEGGKANAPAEKASEAPVKSRAAPSRARKKAS
jgi:hypothetical protein